MQITYLYHSGFLADTKNCYCIFDYYRGTIPPLDQQKPVFVFVSHSHADHYNPHIFDLLREQGMAHIIAVLSKDIPEKRWPDAEGLQLICKASFHQTYELPFSVTAKTLHSTDRGVAYLVECEDCILYHAGDLNDWGTDEADERYNRQMTGSYRHEINLLREWLNGRTPDAAFLPLDPRQGDHYDKGILYFLQKIPAKAVYPMHYWEQPEIVSRFLRENPSWRAVFR